MTFFSGTDTGTLLEEGQSRNNLVSLIVNNAGTYSAAITRYVRSEGYVKEKNYYQFFDKGESIYEDEYETEDYYVEYFMLKVKVSHPKGVQGFLQRLGEILRKKPTATTYNGGYWPRNHSWATPSSNSKPSTPAPKPTAPTYPATPAVKKDEPIPVRSVSDVISEINKENQYANSLFPETTPVEAVKPLTSKDIEEVLPGYPEVDPLCVEDVAIQILSGSILNTITSNFDLKKWIKNDMEKAFKARFGEDMSVKGQFRDWLGNILEFLIYSTEVTFTNNGTATPNLGAESLAFGLHEFMKDLPEKNIYITEIIKQLEDYYD
jgi:hypothetical protein